MSFLDLERVLLLDLLDGDDLPGGLLELPQLAEKVPEAGLGHHGIRGENSHPTHCNYSINITLVHSNLLPVWNNLPTQR